MPERLTITRPEVARALIDLKTAQRLEPFMKRELTLGEAAHELGVKLPALSTTSSGFSSSGCSR